MLQPLPEDAFLCAFSAISLPGAMRRATTATSGPRSSVPTPLPPSRKPGWMMRWRSPQTGLRFRDTVLALGGSRHPMEVFKAFRGREPSTQALLRHRGLVAA
jgi:oligopeptidase A